MRQSRQQETLAGICEREHFVQFYEQENMFLANLKNFVGAALKDDTPCIVVATSGHLRALRGMLQAEGLYEERTESQGKFVVLDAAQSLDRIMVADSPDRKALAKVSRSDGT